MDFPDVVLRLAKPLAQSYIGPRSEPVASRSSIGRLQCARWRVHAGARLTRGRPDVRAARRHSSTPASPGQEGVLRTTPTHRRRTVKSNAPLALALVLAALS